MATSSDENIGQVEQRSGHLEIIGETAAKLLLFQKGWNPYSRFLDQDKVDLILRRMRNGVPEYREIQVKYRRLFVKEKESRWETKHFSAVAWYPTTRNDFVEHRPGLFVMFIFGYPDRRLEKDVLIFPSRKFHELVQRMPQEKSGKVGLYISKARSGDGWYVMLGRRKFAQVDEKTCVDVSQYCNNFDLLS